MKKIAGVEYLTEKEAAEYMGMSQYTLIARRLKGKKEMPVYTKIGGSAIILYPKIELEKWVDEGLKKNMSNNKNIDKQ